jgi:hypothetical protein
MLTPEIADRLIDAIGDRDERRGSELDAADEIAILAMRMLGRMVANAPERGDWREHDRPVRHQWAHCLSHAVTKLIVLTDQAEAGGSDSGLLGAVEEQAADVANWAWLLARAALDAAERRKGGPA